MTKNPDPRLIEYAKEHDRKLAGNRAAADVRVSDKNVCEEETSGKLIEVQTGDAQTGDAQTGDPSTSAAQSGDGQLSRNDLEELARVRAALDFIHAARPDEAVKFDTAEVDTAKFTGDGTGGEKTEGDSGPVPDAFGRFKPVRILGEGGFARVWLAYDPMLDRQVALKVLKSTRAFPDEVKSRFDREARAVAVLSHPGIVPVFETGMVDDERFIVSAYCDGTTLEDWLRNREASVEQVTAANMVIKLAEAVEHAHQRGIIHRDLKPANILVEADEEPGGTGISGRLKITDFGLARYIEGSDQMETADGAIVGTPAYMSPEQAGGERSVGRGSDIYSLGVILYQLLTGRVPHRGRSNIDTLLMIREKEPAPPWKVNPQIHRDLNAICMKCLERSPSRRYATAHELAEDLARWARGEVIVARQATVPERAAKWCARNPVLTVALIAITSALAIALWQWRESSASLDTARTESARAGRYLDRMSAIVDGFLNDIESTGEPGLLTQSQRDRLNEILVLQRSLIEEEKDDPAIKENTLRAFERICSVHRTLGQNTEALDAMREAARWLGSPADWNIGPEDQQFVKKAFGLLLDQAEVLSLSDNNAEAIDTLNEARSIIEYHGEAFSDQEQIYFQLRLQDDLGRALLAGERYQESLEAYETAVDYARMLDAVRDRPEFGIMEAIARALVQVGPAQLRLQQTESARDSALEALQFIDEALAAFPDSRPFLKLRVGALNCFVSSSERLGAGPEEIGPLLEESLATMERLVDEVPLKLEYRTKLVYSLNSYADFLGEQGESEKAIDVCERALAISGDGTELSLEARRMRLHIHLTLASLLRRTGQYGEGINVTAEALDLAQLYFADQPNYSDGWIPVTSLWYERMWMLDRLDEYGTVISEAERCLQDIDSAMASRPDTGTREYFAKGLPGPLRIIARGLAHENRLDEAREYLDAIPEIELDNDREFLANQCLMGYGEILNISADGGMDAGVDFERTCEIAFQRLAECILTYGTDRPRSEYTESTFLRTMRTMDQFEAVLDQHYVED